MTIEIAYWNVYQTLHFDRLNGKMNFDWGN